jgi:hypothetical protein
MNFWGCVWDRENHVVIDEDERDVELHAKAAGSLGKTKETTTLHCRAISLFDGRVWGLWSPSQRPSSGR